MNPVYPKNAYDYDAMKLKLLFEHDDLTGFPPAAIQTGSSRKVFGEFRIPESDPSRVYTMACFVTSIDGKLAFPDKPAGPVVAQANKLDPDGAHADFWTLNLFRANADAVLGGARTLQKEPDGVVCIFDRELEDKRVECSLPPAPWMVINSLDGRDVPFQDTLIDRQPVMFHTSPAGKERIESGLNRDSFVIGPYQSPEAVQSCSQEIRERFDSSKQGKIPILVTGSNGSTDSKTLLHLLRVFGMRRALVESPSFFHVLLKNSLLDEALVNTSGLYIGGDAVGFGAGLVPAGSEDHPHAELLSLHMHSPSFTYSRYRFLYGV